MSAARVSVCVHEDAVLREQAHVFASGAVRAWLYLGEGDVSLWGSPAALSRLAVALLGAANAAERVLAEQGASMVEREVA
jgi:hypothetical protein